MTEAVATIEGQKLDSRYALIDKLGAGGQGEVWRAHDGTRGIDIALKVVRPGNRRDEAWSALEHEHAIACRLEHPNILKVFAPERIGDSLVLPMELASGGDLRRLRGAGFLEIIPVLLELAQAMEHAHERGVVHRDLKPSNVLFDVRGRVRLADFGVAETAANSNDPDAGASATTTNRHGFSPFTASPAQLRGDPPTPSDDIYGLGALAYELLSGYPPYYPRFDKKRAMEERVPELVPARQIPPLLGSLVMRMLEKDPKRRLRTMREVIDELDAALNDTLTFDPESANKAATASNSAALSTTGSSAVAGAAGAAARSASAPASANSDATGTAPPVAALPSFFTSSAANPSAEEIADNLTIHLPPSALPDAKWSPTSNSERRSGSDRHSQPRDDSGSYAPRIREPKFASDLSNVTSNDTIAWPGPGAEEPSSSSRGPSSRRGSDTLARIDAALERAAALAASAPKPAQPTPYVRASAARAAEPHPSASQAGSERSHFVSPPPSSDSVNDETVVIPPLDLEAMQRAEFARVESEQIAARARAEAAAAKARAQASARPRPDKTSRHDAESSASRRRPDQPAPTHADSNTWDHQPEPTPPPAHAQQPAAASSSSATQDKMQSLSALARAMRRSPQFATATPPAHSDFEPEPEPQQRAAHSDAPRRAPAQQDQHPLIISHFDPTRVHEPIMATPAGAMAQGGRDDPGMRQSWHILTTDELPRVTRLEPIKPSRWPWVLAGVLVGAAAAIYFWVPKIDLEGLPPEVAAVIAPIQAALSDDKPGADSQQQPASAVPTADVQQTQPGSPPAATNTATAGPASRPALSPSDEQTLKTLRRVYDSRLAALESRGAGVWGGRDFSLAKTRAAESVGARDAGNSKMAEERLATALKLLDNVDSRAPQALADEVAAGEKALGSGQQEVAGQAFDLARRIDPSDRRAADGQRRTQGLTGVLPLLADAKNAENVHDYARAAQDYSQALSIDPNNATAKAGQARANAAFGDDNYSKAVGAGFAALGAGRLDEAKDSFVKARALKPNGAEALDGLRRVQGASATKGFTAIRQRAADLEAQERWNDAEEVYDDALRQDSSLAFAQEGKARAASRADLDVRLQQLIDRPDRLSAPGVRDDARALLETAEAQSPSGPVIQSQIARLQALLPKFDKPVRLSLISDNSTQVAIWSVGSFGTFSHRDVELRPGKYTVVGTRIGFRDVRREITVSPGQDQQTIKVTCSEPI